MVLREDAFSEFDDELARASMESPWLGESNTIPRFKPSLDLLSRLLTIPVRAGAISQTGRFARAVDAWLAHELRRAGFKESEVWPRPVPPRILSQDVTELLDRLPRKLSEQVVAAIASGKGGSSDARILGRAYVKQTDVVMARWDRGPELLLSTKAMVSSFGKNLANRFEEAYGDAGNLRARYPLAAAGFAFVQRATILRDEPASFERTVDMMRKLRDWGDGHGYTATGLILVDWDDEAPQTTVHVTGDRVPEDISASQFLAAMIDGVLAAAPVDMHVRARELRSARELPVAEDASPRND